MEIPIFENDEFKNWGRGFELFSRRRSSLVRTDYTLTQARKIAQIYNESEGANLGSATCNDCVEKMKNTLQIRFNEHKAWLEMMERKRVKEAIEKAEKEVKDYQEGN